MKSNRSLLPIYMIPASSPAGSGSSSKLVMEDPGSTCNFIMHKLVSRLQLTCEATVVSVKVVGDQKRIMHTNVYKMCLVDMQGEKHKVEAVDMDSQLTIAPAPEAKELAAQFISADKNRKEAFNRPLKKEHLMLGMTLQSLHCTDGMEAGGLRQSRSMFYLGWVLTGCAAAPPAQDQGDKPVIGSAQDEEASARSHPK